MPEQNKPLKAGWKVWRFDQMATNVNVRIDNPSESGMEHYIGLEHLDSDSLKIRRWGSPSDVESTKLCFKKGDIIFGKRRAYQRKLGVAEFDGICSAHAMVLRAKPEVVLSEFLPFFMQSDLFMNRAVEISVGSLSPTINWKTLAAQEFPLPPLKEQEKLLELFISSNEVTESHRSALQLCDTAFLSAIEDLLAKAGEPDTALGDVGVVTDCRHRTPKLVEFGIPMVAPGDIKWGKLNLKGCKHADAGEYEAMKVGVPISLGDIVLSRNQSVGIASYVASDERFVLGQDTVLIQAGRLGVEFLYMCLRSQLVQRQISRLAMGSTFKRINLGDIRRLRVPRATPDLEAHAKVLLKQHEVALEELRTRAAQVETIWRKALNDLVGAQRGDTHVQ
ncbi:restriction endonuclease subunit S [Azotobacter chroococcum]|nr:restriction endonuclease subunit S [Azotobacter chroococcum]